MSDVDPSDYDVAELRDLAGADGGADSGADADVDASAGTGVDADADPEPAVGSGGPGPGESREQSAESPERPDGRRQSGTDDGAESGDPAFLQSTGSTSRAEADDADRDPVSEETPTPRRLGTPSPSSSGSEPPSASTPDEADDDGDGGDGSDGSDEERSLPEETDWTELGGSRASEEADDGEPAPSMVPPARRIEADDATAETSSTTGETVGPGEDTISEIAEWTDIDADTDGPDPTATGASAEPAGTAGAGTTGDSGLQFRGSPGLDVPDDDRRDPGRADSTGAGTGRGADDRSGDHGRSVESAGDAGNADDAGAFERLDVPPDSSTAEDPSDDEVPVFGDGGDGGDDRTTSSDPVDWETPGAADGDSETGSDGDPDASGGDGDPSVLGGDDEPSLSERIEEILDGEDD